jgi:hypothetical protein
MSFNPRHAGVKIRGSRSRSSWSSTANPNRRQSNSITDILYRDSDAESESSSDNECESDDFAMFFGVENEEIIKASELDSPRYRFTEILLPY